MMTMGEASATFSAPDLFRQRRQQQETHSRRNLMLLGGGEVEEFTFQMPTNTTAMTSDAAAGGGAGAAAGRPTVLSLCVQTTLEPHNETLVPVFVNPYDDDSEDDQEEQTWAHKIPRLLRRAVAYGNPVVQLTANVAAAFMTYSLVNGLSGSAWNHSLAIMVVILLVGEAFPPLVAAAACGTCIGGQYPVTVANYGWLLLLSIISGAAWVLVQKRNLLLGFSGRLGSTAFVSMNLGMMLVLGPSRLVPWSQDGSSTFMWKERWTVESAVAFVASTILLAVVPAYFRLRAKIG